MKRLFFATVLAVAGALNAVAGVEKKPSTPEAASVGQEKPSAAKVAHAGQEKPPAVKAVPKGQEKPPAVKVARAGQVAYLERGRACQFRADHLREDGLLARELLRQSLLIAARDELGLLTRDFWLGEPMPDAGASPPLDLAVKPGNPNRVEVFRVAEKARQVVAEQELKLVARDYYPSFISATEKLSRSGFVDVLKKAGFCGKPNAWKASLPLPDDAKRLIEEMTFSSQYLALRQIHAAVRAQGESPELLAGLVRAYANLGLLTEVYLHPAHKVFKARSLLYARRLQVRNVRPLWSQYQRAYAYALVGLHQWALKELEAADKEIRAAGPGKAGERPSWAAILDAFCRYRLEPLDEEKIAAPDRQLYGLLEYVAAELSGSKDLAIATGLRVVKRMPECYRVHDGLCRFAGVSTGHVATVTGLMWVGHYLYPRLSAVADLPANVRAVVQEQVGGGGFFGQLFGGRKPSAGEEFKIRARLIAALLDAGRAEAPTSAKPQPDADLEPNSKPPVPDRAECSWSVLGHLLRELTLVQVLRRASFEHYCLGVSTAQFQTVAAPLVARHPYRPFIESMTLDVAARAKALDRLSRLEPESLEFTAYRLWDELYDSHRKVRDRWVQQAFAQRDDVARDADLTLMVYYLYHLRFVPKLVEASPYSPLARAVFIKEDWKKSESKAAEWEKENQPAVLHALGERYAALERWADAERCLEAAIQRVPAMQSFEALADVYAKQGNEEKWLTTLEAYLQQPDYGLSHGRVRQRIAIHFMEHGQWEKAMPYATGAAETYSCWGLGCAGACHEGLHHWAEAEKYFQAIAERYDSQQLVWYLFCKRTGRGDLSAARDFAHTYVAKRHDKTYYDVTKEIGRFYLLEGDLSKSLTCFQVSFAGTKRGTVGLSAALVADELKDVKARDEALLQVRSPAGNNSKNHKKGPAGKRSFDVMVALAEWMAADLAAGGKARIEPAQLDKWWAETSLVDRQAACYLLGKYMDLHGRTDEAIKLWRQSVGYRAVEGELPLTYSLYTLAAAELSRHGIKPEDCKSPPVAAKKASAK
jgi:tetratricopeptide (TPR) repeat protein